MIDFNQSTLGSLNVTIPKGYEFVRIGSPRPGEYYCDICTNEIEEVLLYSGGSIVDRVYLIVLPLAKQLILPNYLAKGYWYYKNRHGDWYISKSEPQFLNGGWHSHVGTLLWQVDVIQMHCCSIFKSKVYLGREVH